MDKKKKKQSWKLVFIVFSPLILLVIGLFFAKSSLSFSLDEIRPKRAFSFQYSKTASKEELQKLQGIFSQPFYHLIEGERCYVFLSQDKEYVIKFFKMKKLTPKYWLNYIPFPWLEKLRMYKVRGRERARHETFGGFKAAFEEFRYQTDLLFMHLFCTDWLKTKLEVIDREGRSHQIPLDTVPFILKKKAFLIPEYINEFVSQGKNKEAVTSLLLLLDLIRDFTQRGLVNENDSIIEDYGFIADKAVCINSGYILPHEEMKSPANTLYEVFRASQFFEDWLKENQPGLLEEFRKQAEDLLSLLEEPL